MADLGKMTARLRGLGAALPTPEARAEVEAALSSKWEGVQAVAVQVLGGWGGRESVEAIRQFLNARLDREHGWAIRGVAIQTLRPLVTEQDVGWVLDLYFSVPGWLLKHELLWLVISLPPSAAREQLVAALRDQAWENRHAAVKAIGNMDYPDRKDLVAPLSDDPDPDVRRSVAHFTGRE